MSPERLGSGAPSADARALTRGRGPLACGSRATAELRRPFGVPFSASGAAFGAPGRRGEVRSGTPTTGRRVPIARCLGLCFLVAMPEMMAHKKTLCLGIKGAYKGARMQIQIKAQMGVALAGHRARPTPPRRACGS